MGSALVIGGTSYIGRHTVRELTDHGYEVTVLSRGNYESPFDKASVSYLQGDRTKESTLQRAKDIANPDVVVDNAAFFPGDVETAVGLFSNVDAYVYVSSVGAYDHDYVLKYEGDTPLEPCSSEQATDDSFATYPNRKAEGDRMVFEAAENGVNAISIRPTMVYGPHSHLGFLQYWIDRTVNQDRIVVPGDGSFVSHRTFVANVASGIRTVAEEGVPGESYNVADRRPLSVDQTIDLICDVANTDVERAYISPREIAQEGSSIADFPLYMPTPFVMSTDKLSKLGWESTSVDNAMEQTYNYYKEQGLSDYEMGLSRESEEEILKQFA